MKQDLEKRVKVLEEKIKKLEAEKEQHIHFHYPPAPVYQPVWQPSWEPSTPVWPYWQVTCGATGTSGATVLPERM